MQNFIIRSAVVFLVVLSQVSFFSGFLPGQNIPFVLVSYAVALTIIREFKRSLPWIVGAAALFDLISFNIPGESVIPIVIISYVVSFISRKIWVANMAFSWVTALAFIAGGTLFIQIYNILFQMVIGRAVPYFWQAMYLQEAHHILYSILATAAVLAIIYRPLDKIENHLAFFERKAFIKR